MMLMLNWRQLPSSENFYQLVYKILFLPFLDYIFTMRICNFSTLQNEAHQLMR